MTVWKMCPHNEKYEISSAGGIRRGEKILRPFSAKNTGYMQIELSRERYSMHRLVAELFCPGKSEERNVVNHINGIRDDNRAENLEWVTHSENHKHSYLSGRVGSCKGKVGEDHPTSKPVEMLSMDGNVIKKYQSDIEATRDGFDGGCISRCCNGISRHHKGYKWRHAP